MIRRQRVSQPAADVIEPEVRPDQPVEEPPKPPKVSVIIVSYNRAAMLRRCLEAIELCEKRESIQVIVVNNGSTDETEQLSQDFGTMQFIRIPRNFGLTKGLNIGLPSAKGEYLLFLHDDTEVFPDSIRRLAAVLEAEPDAGGVCPLLVTPDGKPAPQLGSFPPSREWDIAEPAPEPYAVKYPRGAALAVRPRFLGAMRKFDERYGQFGSDADLAFQIARSGKKILLVPDAQVIHRGGDESPEKRADFALGKAAFVSKYKGFAAWFGAVAGAALAALAGFRLKEFTCIVGGSKIDGRS